jgi:hypothetical protein
LREISSFNWSYLWNPEWRWNHGKIVWIGSS